MTFGGDAFVRLIVSSRQDDLCPQYQTRGRASPRDQAVSVLRSSLESTIVGAVFMGFILLQKMKPRNRAKVTLFSRPLH